jgi:3-oxoacyl-[acyl-carrier protein] reductase
VIEGMVINHHGRIINISSIAGQVGFPGQTHYAAAKAALIGATRSLAIELAQKQITVNAVAPGGVDTDMKKDEELRGIKSLVRDIPMRRLGKPEEVAYLVSFLCSDRADYISGQVIGINGGAL